MVKLEIGPGYTKGGEGYRFNPNFCPDYDVIYLDVNPPDFQCILWIVADAHNLPFRNNSIDEIFAGHVIEHLENPIRFLRECRRVYR